MHVVILHDRVGEDARADERDVLVQSEAVGLALEELGHRVSTLPCDLDLKRIADILARLKPDLVFNLVESIRGQGRLVYVATALLDALGIPYTGAATEAMFFTSNKLLAKRILQQNGLPTPSWFAQAADFGTSADDLLDESVVGSWIIKSVWEEASLGLDDGSVIEVNNSQELSEELRGRADRLGGEAFAERYVEGREFNIAALGGPGDVQILPPAEIEFLGYKEHQRKIVGYAAKWDELSYEYHHTPPRFDFPPSDEALLMELRRLARRCWEIFGLRGYARVDFRVDERGCPFVLEVNANSCLSSDAGFVAATNRAGLRFVEVVDRILQDTLRLRCESDAAVGSL